MWLLLWIHLTGTPPEYEAEILGHYDRLNDCMVIGEAISDAAPSDISLICVKPDLSRDKGI